MARIDAKASQMLVVHPSVPVDTAAEFVAYAKKNPITYAHAVPGSGGHLAMSYFKLLAGFSGTPVPYSGNPPLMNDLAAGQVQSSSSQALAQFLMSASATERAWNIVGEALTLGAERTDNGRGRLSADEAQHLVRSAGAHQTPESILRCSSAQCRPH